MEGINLAAFKKMGKDFLDALKDPQYTEEEIANGWHGFAVAYLNLDPDKESTELDRIRAALEGPVLLKVIGRKYIEYQGKVAIAQRMG